MPTLSTVILSYNRPHLLKKTVESYLSTITVPYELFIVDNNSSDETKDYINEICQSNSKISSIFLSKNLGGEAINLGLEKAQGDFFHISENDLEYLPGWDEQLLSKFQTFPELGQLCLFSHIPQSEKGEIRERQEYTESITRNNKTIFLAKYNVATPSIFRKEIFEQGVRWKTRPILHDTCRFPADGEFSKLVKKLGYWVAWNDKYTVINWGYNIKEWIEHVDYYLENYRAKKRIQQDGWKKRLNEHGYDLIKKDGNYKIVKL